MLILFIYVLSIFSCLSTFFLFLSLNNKPCCEPRLVSSVMADYISTYYFFEQNSVNNFHNLSARNILLVKYSFLKTLLIKNCYYFLLYQYNIPLFYHDIQTHLIIGQRDIKQMDYMENMPLQLCLNNCSLFFTIKN